MKEFKILAILVIVVGVLYWGVEPLAHSVFNPKTAPADYAFSDLEKLPTTGNVENGKTLATTYCIACHSIEKEGFPALMSNEDAYGVYGVVPPDLSSIGAIYDANFLANLIKDPAKALKLTHKFNDNHPFPMTPTFVSDEELGDMVAWFASVGKAHLESAVVESDEYKERADAIKKNKAANSQNELVALKEQMTNKEVFMQACSRCHSMKYDKVSALTPAATIEAYLGAKAPDLSMMIRSRGEDKLHKFINDPQKILKDTGMPRVGLTKDSEIRVVKYLENIGDSKKGEREFIGKVTIAFMVLLAIFAYLWKRKIWRDLH